MEETASPADIVIVGGGPAGATAAALLAGWGRSVTVLTRPESRSSELGESLPPSTRKLLAHVGSLAAVERAGVFPCTGNTVWWGSAGARVEPFGDGRIGFQVSKRHLERILLDHAEGCGAVVRRDLVVRSVDDGNAGTRRVRATAGSATVTVDASWVLDASGRAGVVARHGWRRPGRATSTLALIGLWSNPSGWDVPEPSHTLVESYDGGWAWSVPVTSDRRYFTVMVDPRHTDVSSRRAIGDTYRTEFARTRHLRRLLETATAVQPPWACDASPYDAVRVGVPGILLVGDAASFIDPLSSFGVKKAVASAWLAAVVANTALEYPDRCEAALALYTSREREMYEASARASADYARAVSDEHPHPFWTDRVESPPAALARPATDPEVLRTDPDVLAAWEDLKRRESMDLAPGPELTVEPRATVSERYVELSDHLVLDGAPIRFLREVNLPGLVRLAGRHSQVPDLFEAYNRTHPPVPLPDFLGALSYLLARHGLVHRQEV